MGRGTDRGLRLFVEPFNGLALDPGRRFSQGLFEAALALFGDSVWIGPETAVQGFSRVAKDEVLLEVTIGKQLLNEGIDSPLELNNAGLGGVVGPVPEAEGLVRLREISTLESFANCGECVDDLAVLDVGLAGVVGLDDSHLGDGFRADPGGLQAEGLGDLEERFVVDSCRLGHDPAPWVAVLGGLLSEVHQGGLQLASAIENPLTHRLLAEASEEVDVSLRDVAGKNSGGSLHRSWRGVFRDTIHLGFSYREGHFSIDRCHDQAFGWRVEEPTFPATTA